MILAIDTATNWTGLAVHDGTDRPGRAGLEEPPHPDHRTGPGRGRDLGSRPTSPPPTWKPSLWPSAPAPTPVCASDVSLAKGLALGHKLPLVGVPTLDIVAAGIGRLEEPLVVVAEAGRNRLWAGRYRWNDRRGWQTDGDPH